VSLTNSALVLALVCALACAAATGCAGCRSSAPATSADAGASVTPSAAGSVDPGQVLARVGDRTITLGEYVAALEHMDQFDRLRYRAPERRRVLLDEMIDVALLAQEARDRGYDQDPETQQELREILRDAMLQTVREGAPAPGDIPAADVRAYYEAHRSDFRDPERRRVSAIVLATESDASQVLAAAQAATRPDAWGELVRGRSLDAHAKADVPLDLAGDLGFVNAPATPATPDDGRGANARVPDEVRAAVFEAGHVGDVVPHVVKASGRYYVVKLAAKSDAHERTLQDAERSIRVKLAQDQLHAREAALVDELRKENPVTVDEAALAQVRVGDASF
jgi:parvulin-like peptidyl-prolyl isomerase